MKDTQLLDECIQKKTSDVWIF